MDQPYLSYLTLLDELSSVLAQLADLAQEKISAVRTDDLMKLNEVLKQEQALALNVRGLEQKMSRQRGELALPSESVSQLVAAYPRELQMRAKQSVNRLQTQYTLYHGVSEVARNTLECNLHEIDKIISDLGGNSSHGPGYSAPDVEPPPSMKTDFRA